MKPQFRSITLGKYGAEFTGTAEAQDPEGVTYKDMGVLPLVSPSVEMRYNLPFCELNVKMEDYRGMGANNYVSADAQVHKHPERDLFGSEMEKLYDEIQELARNSIEKLKERPEIMDKYLNLEHASYDSIFRRYFTISVPKISEKGMIRLKLEIGKEYKTYDNKLSGPMTLDLKNGAVINLDPLCRHVSVFMPQSFSPEESKDIMDFLLGSEDLRRSGPVIEKSNMNLWGYRWSIRFSPSGYPVIEEMFREDISMLPKKGAS